MFNGGTKYCWFHRGSIKISMPREDRLLPQIVWMNRFISATGLRMQMICQFGRRLSVRTIRRLLLTTGYRSRRTAWCPRLPLENRRRRREWERRRRVWDLRQWRHCIFSDESQFSLCHGDGRVRVCCRQKERPIDACVQPNDGNHGTVVMVWGAIHHGEGEEWAGRCGWSHKLASVHTDPEESVGDVNQAQCRRAYSRQQLLSFNGGRRTAHAPSNVSKVNT